MTTGVGHRQRPFGNPDLGIGVKLRMTSRTNYAGQYRIVVDITTC
jgi:hypothetical protein